MRRALTITTLAALACGGPVDADDFGVPTATSVSTGTDGDDTTSTTETTHDPAADTSTGPDALPPYCANESASPFQICFTRTVVDLDSRAVALADLDGDTHLDLASLPADGSVVELHRGDATGELAPPTTLPILDDPAADHPPFTLLSALPSPRGSDRLFVSRTNDQLWWTRGDLGLERIFAAPTKQTDEMYWAYGDLDANGDDDVVVVLPFLEQVRVIACDASTCDEPVVQSLADPDGALRVTVLADLDDDGAADLVGVPQNEFGDSLHLHVWMNTGDGQLEATAIDHDLGTTMGRDHVAMGDLDGDGVDDLVIGERFGSADGGGEIRVFSRYGGDFVPSSTVATTPLPLLAILLVDLEDDGRSEVVALEFDALTIHRLGVESGLTARERLPLEPDTFANSALAAGDLDEDGVPDFVVPGRRENETAQLTVFLSEASP